MNTEDKNRLEAFLRIGQFVPTTSYVPNARGTALFGSIATAATQMQTHATKQIGGKGERHAGSTERVRIGELLRLELVDIGNTGRSLDPEEFPGVGAQFRLPTSGTYQALRATAQAYQEAIGPIKAAFVARAYPADFDEKLAEQIAAFETATQQKARGRQQRRGATAGLQFTMQKAKTAIDELDSILSVYYRYNDPALLAVWKLAKRVQRPAYGTAPAASSSTPTNASELPNGNSDASGEAIGTDPANNSPAN